MDYNAIWQELNRNTFPPEVVNPITREELNTIVDNAIRTQQWLTIKEQLEVLLDDLDNIRCDIESEDHVYSYEDWDTLTCNIRNMQTFIDQIKEVIDKYTRDFANG